MLWALQPSRLRLERPVSSDRRNRDALIKRLHSAEDERWLHLAELKRRRAEADSGLIAAE
jgi:hypothetical protein